MTDANGERLARIEAVLEQHKERMDRQDSHLQQEMLSVLENINATGREVVQMDTLLRGANGDNGLCSRVRVLDRKLDNSDERFERELMLNRDEARHTRRWIMGLVGSIIVSVALFFVRDLMLRP